MARKPTPCGPGADFRRRTGHWHCCICHRTFKRKEQQMTCACGSEDIFDTMDGDWPATEKDDKEISGTYWGNL